MTDAPRSGGAVTEPLPVPERALAIGAHPDDIEFGCGGTLAAWTAAGCELTMLVVTDGSKGTWDRTMAPTRLAAIRKDEQLAAAHALGASHVVHLDHVDGELLYTMALRAAMCLQIRLARPDVVLTHDPWKRYQIHPDHRATGLAVVDGVVAARDHLFFPEQGVAPYRPAALLLWSADEIDHWEDVAATLDRKVAALLCHASQATSSMGLGPGEAGAHDDESRHAEFADRMRTRAAEAGQHVGLAAAEAFKHLAP
jgi:LmbE family N-acetylglucosaminyl deacetylase